MKLRGILALAILAALAGPALADTTVYGPITTNTHWTVAGGPYVSSADITVSGASLTIDPGVTVKLDPGKALNISTNATLIAQGTPSQPITFTTTAPSGYEIAFPWKGIYFDSNSVDATFDGSGNYTGGSILKNCTVQYTSGNNGAVYAYYAAPYLANDTFQKNANRGVYATSSPGIRIEGNLITQNSGGGVSVDNSSGIRVTGNTISQNSLSGSSNGTGIYAYNAVGAYVAGNIISQNSGGGSGGGLYLSTSQNTVLAGNQITNNSIASSSSYYGAGIYLTGSNSVALTDNTITGNLAPGSARAGGVYIASTSNSAAFSGNLIQSNTGSLGAGVYLAGGDATTFTGDHIINNAGYGLCLSGGADYSVISVDVNNPTWLYGNATYQIYDINTFSSFLITGPGSVDARNVWWNTLSDAAIQAGAYDFYDSNAYGIVFYSPYAQYAPEPATLSLLALGGLAVVARRRRAAKQ